MCGLRGIDRGGGRWRQARNMVTVFSAPAYCGEFDNAAAMMTVDESLMCSFQVMRSSASIGLPKAPAG